MSNTEDVPDLDAESLEELMMQLRSAKRGGCLVVPVIDSMVEDENLRVRFARIPLPDPAGDGEAVRSYIPVFTSADELVQSGMPTDTRCAQPSPEDLIAVLGPSEWIAVNPGPHMVGLKISDFIKLWNQLPLEASEPPASR